MSDFQALISSHLNELTPAAHRVASVIMEDLSEAVNLTISELAARAGTSEPTVLRFCRVLGFRGYPQLRLALAAEVGRHAGAEEGLGLSETVLRPEDTLAEMVAKVRFNETRGIDQTLAAIDLDNLDRIVSLLDEASKIHLYGVGAGDLVARDMYYKLFRVGRNAAVYSNPHDALMAAALMGKRDVVMAFSHSGTTAFTLDFISTARGHGARAVVLTNAPGSPLELEADFSMRTEVRESPFRSGAMSSRLAQLALIDCIFIAVAQRRYDATARALELTREVVVPAQRRDFSL